MMIWASSWQNGMHVNQFVRINARGGIRGEIADVVRAGAARVQADGLDAPQDFRRVLRLDETHLKIRARRDLDVAAWSTPSRFAPVRAVEMSSTARRESAAGP